MLLKIEDGFLVDKDNGDKIIAVITNATPEEQDYINYTGEAAVALDNFIESVNSGKFHPRKVVKTLEQLKTKHNIH